MILQILAPTVCLAIPCAYVLKLGVNSCMVGKLDSEVPPPPVISAVPIVPPPQQHIG